ncbi:MAG TPA: retropepsin-like aspartic protease [Thermoplasmata archaeon]|nr:retropepsin-like aspartic protease [Thermoplasmata archaeon]
MPSSVPFERVAHVLVLPVTLGAGAASRFVFDTGIGMPVVDLRLAERLGIHADGRIHRGRRMSGQELEVPLAVVPELRLGDRRWSEVTVGLADLRALLPPSMAYVGGFLSLGQAETSRLRIDYSAGTVTIDATIPERTGGVSEVPLHLLRDGPSLSAFADLALPDGSTARVEVDLGSDRLILHDRFMGRLGFDPGGPSTEVHHGKDETGHEYVRRFGTLGGTVSLGTAVQRDPPVMFQEIIYDGLVGDQFLRRFDVTFDVPGSRLWVGPARA